MVKKARRDDLEIFVGDSVIGYHQGWPYAATVERILPYSQLSNDGAAQKPGNFFLLRWTGFSGKKALSIVRGAQIAKNDAQNSERRRQLETARRDGDVEVLEKLFSEIPQLNSGIRAPLEIYHKSEFSVISEAFQFPAKLRDRLIEIEEGIVAQEPPLKVTIPVSQVIAEWLKATDLSESWKFLPGEADSFAESLTAAFNRLALTSLLYAFELPARIKQSREPAVSFLGPDALLRLLSIFPEISAAIHSALPADKFSKILELIKGFNCLCDFLCKNFKRFFPISDSLESAGLYYLPKDVVVKAAVANVPVQAGKRKPASHLVKKIQ